MGKKGLLYRKSKKLVIRQIRSNIFKVKFESSEEEDNSLNNPRSDSQELLNVKPNEKIRPSIVEIRDCLRITLNSAKDSMIEKIKEKKLKQIFEIEKIKRAKRKTFSNPNDFFFDFIFTFKEMNKLLGESNERFRDICYLDL